MKLLSLVEIADLLSNPAYGFLVNGRAATLYLNRLTYQDNNVFLLVTWTDSAGYEYSVAFAEGVNREVKEEVGILSLIDTDGEILRLTFAPKAS